MVTLGVVTVGRGTGVVTVVVVAPAGSVGGATAPPVGVLPALATGAVAVVAADLVLVRVAAFGVCPLVEELEPAFDCARGRRAPSDA